MAAIVLPARYLDAAGVECDCVVRCASLDDIVVETDAVPALGERVICRVAGLGTLSGIVEGLGMLGGPVGRPAAGGFWLILNAGAERRRRLAARIEWARASMVGNGERRQSARVKPRIQDIVVGWGGKQGAGRLRDLSATGAAVDLLQRPPIGTPITIGARRAIVARHTEHGVAVRFVLPLNPADLHENAIVRLRRMSRLWRIPHDRRYRRTGRAPMQIAHRAAPRTWLISQPAWTRSLAAAVALSNATQRR